MGRGGERRRQAELSVSARHNAGLFVLVGTVEVNGAAAWVLCAPRFTRPVGAGGEDAFGAAAWAIQVVGGLTCDHLFGVACAPSDRVLTGALG